MFNTEDVFVPSQEIEDSMLDTVDFISDSCRKYIDLVEPRKNYYVTQLDKERRNLCLREMVPIKNIDFAIFQN